MISIVIPTFNEEIYLPKLLGSIAAQDFLDYEIIVADNGSSDCTVEIALENKARVVGGGIPPIARNNGAAAAEGQYILFVDADVIIPPGFLSSLFERFQKDYIDICIPARKPSDTDRQVFRTLFDLSNRYFKVMARIKPLGLGNCILVTRRLHQRIGGFDESMRFGEDYDYINRAARVGRFKVYLNISFYASVRRVELEGIRASFRKSLKSDLLFLFTGKPDEKAIHEFGMFTNEHLTLPGPQKNRSRRPGKKAKASKRIKKKARRS